MQSFLAGTKVNLKGLGVSQIKPDSPYYCWLDDLSLDLYSERSYFPNSESRMERYFESATAGKLVLLGIFDAASDKHLGNITLQDIDWINRRGFIGYLIGDKEFTGKGIASDACLMLLYYAFNKLNLDRVWTTVSVENAASLKVAKKAGLKEEGRLRGHQMRNGSRHDLLAFGALREEWTMERGERARACFAQLPI
jgi:ribosomal-protein-alanine N-acetyltransferase